MQNVSINEMMAIKTQAYETFWQVHVSEKSAFA